MIELHKSVKKLCVDKGITMKELANKMGVNKTTLYSAIRNGNPTLSTIENIAKGLDVKVSEVIAGGER